MNRKIFALLFALVAISFCLMGEISLQDVSKSSFIVMSSLSSYIIGQPLDLGPQCYLIDSEADCQSTSGCEFNYDDGRCQSKRLDSDLPSTITMKGDCSPGSPYGELVTQVIAKFDGISWTPLTTCTDYADIGGGRLSCLEEDGRVTIWDTNTCTISADLVVRQAELQVIQFPILNFLFDAIENGNVVIFTLSIAIAFAIGLYISEVISKPKSHRRWKRYVKKNPKKVRKGTKEARKTSPKHRR